MDQFNFDLTPVEIGPYTIGGEKYVIKEASEGIVAKWRNTQINKARLGDNGKPVAYGNIADTKALLVSLCLWKETESGRQPVPESTIKGWPSRIVDKLHKKIMEISELEDDDDTKEKLEERIKRDQAKLDAINQESVKNEPNDMEVTSA